MYSHIIIGKLRLERVKTTLGERLPTYYRYRGVSFLINKYHYQSHKHIKEKIYRSFVGMAHLNSNGKAGHCGEVRELPD